MTCLSVVGIKDNIVLHNSLLRRVLMINLALLVYFVIAGVGARIQLNKHAPLSKTERSTRTSNAEQMRYLT